MYYNVAILMSFCNWYYLDQFKSCSDHMYTFKSKQKILSQRMLYSLQ